MSRNRNANDPDVEVLAGTVVARVPVNAEGKPICGALKKADRVPCQHSAGYGTDHVGFGACKFHGGSVSSGRVGAARQEILEYVGKMKALGEIEAGVSPDEAMIEEIARAQSSVEWFDKQIKFMTSDENGVPLDGEAAQAVATSNAFNKIMYQWTEQRRLLTTVTSMAVRAGLMQRSIEIQEMQAAAVLTAVLAVVGSPELGLQPQQVDYAKRMIASQLRDLATGPEQRAAMARESLELEYIG